MRLSFGQHEYRTLMCLRVSGTADNPLLLFIMLICLFPSWHSDTAPGNCSVKINNRSIYQHLRDYNSQRGRKRFYFSVFFFFCGKNSCPFGAAWNRSCSTRSSRQRVRRGAQGGEDLRDARDGVQDPAAQQAPGRPGRAESFVNLVLLFIQWATSWKELPLNTNKSTETKTKENNSINTTHITQTFCAVQCRVRGLALKLLVRFANLFAKYLSSPWRGGHYKVVQKIVISHSSSSELQVTDENFYNSHFFQ